MGHLLIALAVVAQCGGYSAGYSATSYSYAAPAYYNAAVTYVPYVQAVKFVAVEPSYGDLYPSLVAGELRAARRYDVMERLEAALERMSAPAPAAASFRYRAEAYRAPAAVAPMPSDQYEAPPPAYPVQQGPAKVMPAYPVQQAPPKVPPPAYPAKQAPAKVPPRAYSAPQVPAKAPPPAYSAPQVPAKSPLPSYSAPQVPDDGDGPYGGVGPPPPPLAEPTIASAVDGAGVLASRCSSCHTRGRTRGNSFAIFGADGRLDTNLTPDQVSNMVARVEAGDMPPTGALPADEVSAIRAYLGGNSGSMASN